MRWPITFMTAVKRSPNNGLQRPELEVLVLVLEAAYSNKHDEEPPPAPAAHDELVWTRLETRRFETRLVSLRSAWSPRSIFVNVWPARDIATLYCTPVLSRLW